VCAEASAVLRAVATDFFLVAEPCEKTYCAYGANCVQTSDGRAECQCPTECPDMFTPVCGTDGVTYTNHCMMRMKSCREERNTRVQHAGDCGEYGIQGY
jgi:coxsackievirus/adenovirus receptor